MTATKQRVLEKTEAALAVLTTLGGKNSQGTISLHGGERIPLLGSSSTMLQNELDKIQSRWVQAYKKEPSTLQ